MTGPPRDTETATPRAHGMSAPPARGEIDSERAVGAPRQRAAHAADSMRAADAVEPRVGDAPESSACLPLLLQKPLEPRADGRYHISELFAFHDRAFVESAYAATLGRAPSADELAATLADLRAARRDKREIVEDLIESEEGARRGAGARVGGARGGTWKRRVSRLPVVGYLWQLLAALAHLPVSLRHQREFATYALAQQQLIAEHFNAQVENFNAQARAHSATLDELRRRLVAEGEELRRFADSADAEFRRLQLALDESLRGINDAYSAVSLHSDVLAAAAARQEALDRRLDAQHEYLAQEQQAIVEAQKAVLVEIEGRFRDALASQADALAALSARVAGTRAREEEGRRVPEGLAREGGAETV